MSSERTIVEVVGQIAWGVRHKGHASTGEVEIVEAEAEATDAFVGVVIEAEVIGASLPAQLDVGANYVSIKF